MAGGQGTHATQNRLTMYAAVEAALGVLPELEGFTPEELAAVRSDLLAELHKRGHVIGHATDRHHELQARCAELLAIWDSAGNLDDIPGVQAMEAIREVVANPLRPADPADPRGPRLVPRRDPHLCWRIHPGAQGACQLPDGHDLPSEQGGG